MQKILFAIAFIITKIGLAQTAVNFTCNDCYGESHDLFSELDAGKVIVICWVEPCGGCADASIISSTLVESFQEDYPDKVYMYLVDDYANTDCESLISWANMFGIHPTTFFSDPSVDMFDYGEPGMPKVVVVGDVNHQVFYNADFTVDATALEEAINSAIIATMTNIDERRDDFSTVHVYPNPTDKIVTVSFYLGVPSEIQAEIFDQSGRIVFKKAWNNLSDGLSEINLDIAALEDGIYILKLSDGSKSRLTKMVVMH